MTPNYQNTTLRHKLEIADGKQREDWIKNGVLITFIRTNILFKQQRTTLYVYVHFELQVIG
jgi:hypothetical protein